MFALGMVLGILIDPIAITIAIVGGLFVRSWFQAIIVAIVAAVIIEIMIAAISPIDRGFRPVVFLIRIVASLCWVSITYWIRNRYRTKSGAGGA